MRQPRSSGRGRDHLRLQQLAAAVIDRLLRQKPKITGVSMPGMPFGVPGMGGKKEGPIAIYEIGPGTPKVYATE